MRFETIFVAAFISSAANAGQIPQNKMSFCVNEAVVMARTHEEIKVKGASLRLMQEVERDWLESEKDAAYAYIEMVRNGQAGSVADVSAKEVRHTVLMTCINAMSKGDSI